jgi:hypothetical protein
LDTSFTMVLQKDDLGPMTFTGWSASEMDTLRAVCYSLRRDGWTVLVTERSERPVEI